MKRLLAIIALFFVYAATKLVAVLSLDWKKRSRSGYVLVNGTFHNPNWFHAHITPLVQSGYGPVVLITDEPIVELDNLIYHCPPIWANRFLSRAGAKALWSFYYGWKYGADIYVGYHIFPSAVSTLICARILGAQCVYQVTSGQLELEGGGWHAENKLLVALGGPSSLVERMVLSVVREFDLAIVRGSAAGEYLRKAGFRRSLEAVTGSVDMEELVPGEKDIDVIFVGRLTEYKRPDRLVNVIGKVVESHPQCVVKLVGDGPDRDELEDQAKRLGIENNVEFMGQRSDVPTLVARAKVFILTSRWEGVSIAMLEAMGMEAVPVVSDVGDLADFAVNDETGFVIPEDEIDAYADAISRLLDDEDFRLRLAKSARELVSSRCDRVVLSRRWGVIFNELAATPGDLKET